MHPESGLRKQFLSAPADAGVLDDAARSVVGHSTALPADTATAEFLREERVELRTAAVNGLRTDGLAVVPVRCEAVDDRVGVTPLQGFPVTPDDAIELSIIRREDRWAQMVRSEDRLLAAVAS